MSVEYEKVSKITGPGFYLFAANPNDKSKIFRPMPDGTRPPDNLVNRFRPGLEKDLQKNIHTLHPNIRVISSINTLLSKMKLNDEAFVRHCSRPWYGQKQGVLIVKKEYCWMSTQPLGLTEDLRELNPASFCLKDSGKPYIDGGKWIYAPESPDKNGKLNLQLIGSSYLTLDERGPFWRGSLKIAGDKLGTLIEDSISYINHIVCVTNIPLWKEIKTT